MTPTSRTTTALRAHEIPYEIVEHWKSYPRKAPHPGMTVDKVRTVMDKGFDPGYLSLVNFRLSCDEIAKILQPLHALYEELSGNAENKVRQDLFGFIDILALTDDYTVGLQVTSGTNLSARVAKLREPKIEPKVKAWLSHESRRLLLLGWRELATPVEHWAPRVVEMVPYGPNKDPMPYDYSWSESRPRSVRGVQDWISTIVREKRS